MRRPHTWQLLSEILDELDEDFDGRLKDFDRLRLIIQLPVQLVQLISTGTITYNHRSASIISFNHQLQSSASIISFNHQLQSSASIISFNHQLQSSASIINFNHQLQSSASIISFNHQLQLSTSIINFQSSTSIINFNHQLQSSASIIGISQHELIVSLIQSISRQRCRRNEITKGRDYCTVNGVR